MARKHKWEFEHLQAGVKYHEIYQTKKAKTEDEGEMILSAKESKQRKGRMISKLFPDLCSHPTNIFKS